MEIRDFALDEFADENIGVFGDSLSNAKDLLTLRMAPPATPNRASRDSLGKTRHRAAGCLEHDAVSLHEGQALRWAHLLFATAPLVRRTPAAHQRRPLRIASAAVRCNALFGGVIQSRICRIDVLTL